MGLGRRTRVFNRLRITRRLHFIQLATANCHACTRGNLCVREPGRRCAVGLVDRQRTSNGENVNRSHRDRRLRRTNNNLRRRTRTHHFPRFRPRLRLPHPPMRVTFPKLNLYVYGCLR